MLRRCAFWRGLDRYQYSISIYVCTYVRTYVCMYVCMHVCVYIYVHMTHTDCLSISVDVDEGSIDR